MARITPTSDVLLGAVRFLPDDRAFPTVVVGLGDGPAQVTDGYGGWTTKSRAGSRRALTVHESPAPVKLAIPVLFDGWREAQGGRSIEADIRDLEALAGVDLEDEDEEPPTVSLRGAVPHDAGRVPDRRWVIENIEWGDTIRRSTDGHRVRQAATVTVMQHVEDETLAAVKAPRRRPKYRRVRAKKGDTFEKIAKRELDTKRLGRQLARANDGRTPDKILKTGREVRVPTGKLLAEWRKSLR